MAGAATDVEHRRRRLRKVLQEMLVHHVGAYVPLDGGVRLVGELVRQAGPGVLAHSTKLERCRPPGSLSRHGKPPGSLSRHGKQSPGPGDASQCVLPPLEEFDSGPDDEVLDRR